MLVIPTQTFIRMIFKRLYAWNNLHINTQLSVNARHQYNNNKKYDL